MFTEYMKNASQFAANFHLRASGHSMTEQPTQHWWQQKVQPLSSSEACMGAWKILNFIIVASQ